jgi:hypothetical protein
MKKILGVLIIAGTMVACNNSSEAGGTNDSTNKDSGSTMAPDTSSNMSTPDTTTHMSDTGTKKTGADTTKK